MEISIRDCVSVVEGSEFTLDTQRAGTFFDVAYHLGIDVERLAGGYHLIGHLRTNIDFHAVTHVEYLIHLTPVSA